MSSGSIIGGGIGPTIAFLLVEKNQSDVTEELERLPRGESLLDPLEPLEAGFWNLAKLNVRRAMARHPGHPYEQGFSLKLWPQRLGQPLKSATLAWSKRHSSHRSPSACAACQWWRLRGHGALYVTGTTAPPRNDSSDFTGKPPFGHFFGIMP
jgi:hypothetical protein